VAYYEGLIRLRKKLPGLCDKSAEAYKRISEKQVQQEGLVSFVVDNTGTEEFKSEWSTLFVAYNANSEQVEVQLPEGEWVILADKNNTDCQKAVTVSAEGKFVADAASGIMLAKK